MVGLTPSCCFVGYLSKSGSGWYFSFFRFFFFFRASANNSAVSSLQLVTSESGSDMVNQCCDEVGVSNSECDFANELSFQSWRIVSPKGPTPTLKAFVLSQFQASSLLNVSILKMSISIVFPSGQRFTFVGVSLAFLSFNLETLPVQYV